MSYFYRYKNAGLLPIRAFFQIAFVTFLLLSLQGISYAKEKNALNPDDLYKDARHAFYSLKETGDPKKDRNKWTKVGELFVKVYDLFPDSHRSDDALYTCARIYKTLYTKYQIEKDLKQVLHFSRKVTREYPSSRLADDAQFMIATIFLEIKKDKRKALDALEKIPNLYPGGDKVQEAKRLIASLPKKAPQESPHGGNLVKVNSIRHWSNPSYTRVVIDIASSIEFKENRLRNPDRLYVDLYNAHISKDLSKNNIAVNDVLLKQVRASQFKPNVVRVVFDVENFDHFEIFSYENPFRIVLDIKGEPSTQTKKAGSSKATASRPHKEENATARLSSGTKIVIDPGHGGKDNGATGYQGIKEKDVVLDIALRLKKILVKNLACKVILTREKDVYLELLERTAIANTSYGDIFISIHGNAAPRKNAYGIETYFLSNAKSEKALETASRENMVTTKDMSDDLKFILSDMLANSNMRESSELAGVIQKNLVGGLKTSYSNIKDLGAKGGPFYVLHGANMPSVLTEVGFLSNPMEAKRIRQHKYRQKIALSLYNGIKGYLQEMKLAKRVE